MSLWRSFSTKVQICAVFHIHRPESWSRGLRLLLMPMLPVLSIDRPPQKRSLPRLPKCLQPVAQIRCDPGNLPHPVNLFRGKVIIGSNSQDVLHLIVLVVLEDFQFKIGVAEGVKINLGAIVKIINNVSELPISLRVFTWTTAEVAIIETIRPIDLITATLPDPWWTIETDLMQDLGYKNPNRIIGYIFIIYYT